MIECVHIGARVGNFEIRDVDFVVPTAAHCVLTGPTASGKTTLLEIIAGAVAPTTGNVRIAGLDVTANAPELRGVGLVPQHGYLFPHLSTRENISYGTRDAGTVCEHREAIRDRASDGPPSCCTQWRRTPDRSVVSSARAATSSAVARRAVLRAGRTTPVCGAARICGIAGGLGNYRTARDARRNRRRVGNASTGNGRRPGLLGRFGANLAEPDVAGYLGPVLGVRTHCNAYTVVAAWQLRQIETH